MKQWRSIPSKLMNWTIILDHFCFQLEKLMGNNRGIDIYLRDRKYPSSLVKDREFATSRAVLASKRKELKQKGKGYRPNTSTPLSFSKEKVLKDKICVGLKVPSSS